MSDERTVNVPLLRKAVEWAEAEAAKPAAERQWRQAQWRTTASECGTAFCIAGYIAELHGWDWDAPQALSGPAYFAMDLLGIPRESWENDEHHLFESDNTIEDVRRIAEDLAGERL